jgi:hypothetical protein
LRFFLFAYSLLNTMSFAIQSNYTRPQGIVLSCRWVYGSLPSQSRPKQASSAPKGAANVRQKGAAAQAVTPPARSPSHVVMLSEAKHLRLFFVMSE